MKPTSRFVLAVAGAVLLSLFACTDSSGEGPPGAGDKDAGNTHAEVTDAGLTDAGLRDAGVTGAFDVHGKVIALAGQPSASVRVLITSGDTFSAYTSTDSFGNFTVTNVPTPYDATVVTPPWGATVTVGLTSATPTVLDWFGIAGSGGGVGSVSGVVTGGTGFPSPEGYRTSVAFASPEIQTDQYLIADVETGAYTTDRFNEDYGPTPLSWSGPSTTVGTLHALQWQQTYLHDPGSVHVPAAYSGYGSRANVSLANGSTLTGQNIALSPVPAATFSGTYTAPRGYSVDTKYVALRFEGGGLMPIVVDRVASDEPFSYPTPDIPGATLLVLGTSINEAAYSTAIQPGLPVNATGIVVASGPAASKLTAPPNEADGVGSGTSFSWTPVSNGVHLLVIQANGPYFLPAYVIVTSGTSATIPELASLGVPLPTSTQYQWTVYAVGPYASVDEASVGLTAEHPWPLGALGGFLLDARTPGFVTAASPRTFTTAPSPWDY